MTIKEIKKLTGCGESTIKRVIRELYPTFMVNGKKTKLTKEMALQVVGELRVPIKKNITQNSLPNHDEHVPNHDEHVPNHDEQFKKEELKEVVMGVFKELLPYLQQKPIPEEQKNILKKKEPLQLAILPDKTMASQINQLVRAYCYENKVVTYSEAWRKLYTEFRDLYTIDLPKRAKNKEKYSVKDGKNITKDGKVTGLVVAKYLDMESELHTLAYSLFGDVDNDNDNK